MVKLEDIQEIINNIINEYYGLNIKCSIIKSSPYYQVALAMSEKYGLRIKKCTRTQLRFEDNTNHYNPLNDKITSTELRFDELINETNGENKYVNLFNGELNERENFTLDQLLGYYDSMPQPLKNGVSLITFEPTGVAPHSFAYEPPLRKENIIHITNEALKDNNPPYTLERVMAHEMAHCLEMSQLNSRDKNIFKKIYEGEEDMSQEDTRYFYEVIQNKMYTYSKPNGLFGEAVEQEYHEDYNNFGVVNREDLIHSTYAENYYYNNMGEVNRFSEHFAETVSVLSFRDRENKNDAMIGGGEFGEDSISYYEYVLEGGQVRSIPVVEELLYGNTKNYNIEYVPYD